MLAGIALLAFVFFERCADEQPATSERDSSAASSSSPITAAPEAAAPAVPTIPVPSPDQSRASYRSARLTGREQMRYFVAIDNSASSGDGHNRRPTIEELEPAFARLLQTGGEIAIVEIVDGARPLHRLHIPPPPGGPAGTPASPQETVFDQAVDEAEQQSRRRRFASQYDAWAATQRQRITAFRAEIDEIFHPLALSHGTLLGSVIKQADAYFSEQGFGEYVPALIIVSDAVDTGSRAEDLQFTWSRPNVVVVNDSGDLASLSYLRALRTTSLTGAIELFNRASGAGV